MAVGDGAPAVKPRVVDEPRRWAAFHCFGVYNLLMFVQAAYEDMVGALETGHLELVRHSARDIALLCLRIGSLRRDGLPPGEYDPFGNPFYDPFGNPFAGLDTEEIASTLRGANRVVEAADAAAMREALPEMEARIEELVRGLGFTVAPASIRTATGLFPALKLTREMLPVNKAAHLPLVFPRSWAGPSASGRQAG